MDHAQKGAKALEAKDFEAAVKHYTAAIAEHPKSPDYYVKRSAAYIRISPADYTTALQDAEAGVVFAKERGKRELIGQAQLRRAIALYNKEQFADADNCLRWAKAILDKDNSIIIWESKTKDRLKELADGDERGEVHVKEVPDIDMDGVMSKAAESKAESDKDKAAKDIAPKASANAPTPASKIRHEWYQSSDKVTFSLMAKGVPKDKANVDIQRGSLSISFPLPTGSDFDFSVDPFYAPVDPTNSSFKILSTKVEVVLAKAQPGHKWHDLEGTAAIQASAQPEHESGDVEMEDVAANAPIPGPSGPAYPTSSKHGTKNWDKVAEDLTKKPQKEGEGGEDVDSEEEGDAVNGFFKKLYKNADPDTRRAMMKSYQESNGTALSTNWGEVKKGTVSTDPPEGMVAKKWGA